MAADSQLTDLQQQITDLQMIVAHHEAMHQELEKSLLNMTNRFDDLHNRYQVVVRLIQSLQESSIKRADEEVPPPHY